MYSIGETDMVSKAGRTEFTCRVLYNVLLQPKNFILHPPYMVVNYHGAPQRSASGMNFRSHR